MAGGGVAGVGSERRVRVAFGFVRERRQRPSGVDRMAQPRIGIRIGKSAQRISRATVTKETLAAGRHKHENIDQQKKTIIIRGMKPLLHRHSNSMSEISLRFFFASFFSLFHFLPKQHSRCRHEPPSRHHRIQHCAATGSCARSRRRRCTDAKQLDRAVSRRSRRAVRHCPAAPSSLHGPQAPEALVQDHGTRAHQGARNARRMDKGALGG